MGFFDELKKEISQAVTELVSDEEMLQPEIEPEEDTSVESEPEIQDDYVDEDDYIESEDDFMSDLDMREVLIDDYASDEYVNTLNIDIGELVRSYSSELQSENNYDSTEYQGDVNQFTGYEDDDVMVNTLDDENDLLSQLEDVVGEVIHNEISEEIVEEVSEEIPEVVIEEVSEEIPEVVIEEVSEEIPEAEIEEVLEETIEEVLENVTETNTENVTEMEELVQVNVSETVIEELEEVSEADILKELLGDLVISESEDSSDTSVVDNIDEPEDVTEIVSEQKDIETQQENVSLEFEIFPELAGILNNNSIEEEPVTSVEDVQAEQNNEFEEEKIKEEEIVEVEEKDLVINENDIEASSEPLDETAVITKGLTVKGDLVAEGSVNIFGTVEGNIQCKGKVMVSGNIYGNSAASELFANNAHINGNIDCTGSVKIGQGSIIIGNITGTSAVIAGAVKGDIDIKGPVVVDSSAIVMGDIKSKSVQINIGAAIEGRCSQCYADVSPTAFFKEN